MVNIEVIGATPMEQGMELARPEQLVVQVSKMNIHNTHREAQSRATDAASRDTSAQHVLYRRCTATIVEHQTMAPELAKGTTIPTAAHQTAIAARDTTPHHPHHRAKQTDCSHL